MGNFTLNSRLFQSNMVRNTGKMLTGNVIAQAISLLIYPLLSRLYTPDDFGVLNVFFSIGGFLILLATANYQNAILLPKQDGKAVSVFHVGMILTVAVTILTIASIPFKGLIAKGFGNSEIGTLYPLMPIYVFGSALWVMLCNWLIREKQFTKVSSYQVYLSTINASAKSAFGFAGVKAGMVISMVFAPIAALLCCISRNIRQILQPLFKFNFTEIREAAKEYDDFPKYSLPSSLVNYFSTSLPVFILTPYFSITEIGLYTLAITVAFKPVNIVTTSIHHVLFQRFADDVANKRNILPKFKKYSAYLAGAALVLFVPLFFILPHLTEWLFGSEWRDAGEYIRLMLPWLFFLTLVSANHFVPYLFKQQKGLLVFEIIYVVLRASALITGVALCDFYTSLALFFGVNAVVILAQYIWIYRLVSSYEKQL